MLRYWEQEFSQLRPMKRRGNRRYYQLHEIKLICQIRQLLYEQGFTIVGARNKLQELITGAFKEGFHTDPVPLPIKSLLQQNDNTFSLIPSLLPLCAPITQNMMADNAVALHPVITRPLLGMVRHELMSIRDLLEPIA